MEIIRKHLKRYKYKNLTFFAISLFFTFLLSRNETFHSYLLHLGNVGYFGAFVSGILFVSTFTVAIAILIFLVLAESLSPIEIGLISGCGAVIGDMLIFHFTKNNLSQEINSLYSLFDHNRHLVKILNSKYFSWTLPVVGAILIASPLPDEIGVSLMGISKMKTVQFLLLSFVLNSIGISLIVVASTVIKP